MYFEQAFNCHCDLGGKAKFNLREYSEQLKNKKKQLNVEVNRRKQKKLYEEMWGKGRERKQSKMRYKERKRGGAIIFNG